MHCSSSAHLSTDIHDAAAGTEREQPLFGEPGEAPGKVWLASELTALFEADANIPFIVQAAAEAAQLASVPSYRITPVEEQDWVRITQSQFDPIRISSRLWIVRAWHVGTDPAAINLILDPGLAFGTGSHPSTQLCLAWLDSSLQAGEDVLDYGCGSGILTIAAAKLGAARVIGVDIDPLAVAASRGNALLNHCETKVEFHTAHFADQANTPEKSRGYGRCRCGQHSCESLDHACSDLNQRYPRRRKYRAIGHSVRASGRGDTCLSAVLRPAYRARAGGMGIIDRNEELKRNFP